MLSINEAKYAGGYSLQLSFNNGKKGTANLVSSPYPKVLCLEERLTAVKFLLRT